MEHIHQRGKLVLSGSLVVNERKEILLLFKKNHQHWETPGGKVRRGDCLNIAKPTIGELSKTALRELFEELGRDLKVAKLKYFGKVEFTIPDGRKAIVHKFMTRILSGKPKIAEPEVFSKLEYLPIKKLGKYPISPDLNLLLPRIRARFN